MISFPDLTPEDNFTHAYFISDEHDQIRLGLLFELVNDSVICSPFNERTHSTMPDALSALVSQARHRGFEELRVTLLQETGILKISLDDDQGESDEW